MFKDLRHFTKYFYFLVFFFKCSELIIRSFNSSDAGRYECRAKNKVNRNIEKRALMIKAYPGECLWGQIIWYYNLLTTFAVLFIHKINFAFHTWCSSIMWSFEFPLATKITLSTQIKLTQYMIFDVVYYTNYNAPISL